jgi:MFS family permease
VTAPSPILIALILAGPSSRVWARRWILPPLLAYNLGPVRRPRAYRLVASAGATAVAAGPLIGGLFTTYLSCRWLFVDKVNGAVGDSSVLVALPVQVQPPYRRTVNVRREADGAREPRWRPRRAAARTFEVQALFPWLPCNGPRRGRETLSGSSSSQVTGAGWGADPEG